MAKHKLSYALPVAAMAMGAFAAMPTAVMAGTSTRTYRTLDGNEENCYTINSGDQVEIDLNGYSITCANGSAIAVEKDATLVVKDSKNTGEVISKTGGAAVLNKGGTVTIENGKYFAENWYTIKNLGTMVINNGTIGGTEHKNNSSLVDNGWFDGTSTTGHANDKGVVHGDGEIAVLTINGGSFMHLNTTSTIKSDDYSKTIINNGAFESAQGNLVQATGDVTINNGKFTGYGAMIVFSGDGSEIYPGKAEINGGTINAKYIAKSAGSNATLKITGGEFSGLESVVYGSTSTFNGEGITGGIFNITPETLLAEKYNYGKTRDGDFTVLSPADLERLDNDGYELDDEHNVISKKTDYKGETEGSDASKAKEGETAIDGSVEFIGDAEIDRQGYFLITDHGTDGLVTEATSSDSKLVAAFDLNMYDRNDNIVKVSDSEMKVKIALTEEQYNELKQYDSVVAVYFDENGNETEERIAAELVADENGNYYVVFTVTHFSTYGIIGMNEETATATTPETGTMTAAGASAANAGILAAATAAVISAIVGIAAIIRRK